MLHLLTPVGRCVTNLNSLSKMNLEKIRHELALLERQLHELAAKIQTGEGIGRLVSDCAPDSLSTSCWC